MPHAPQNEWEREGPRPSQKIKKLESLQAVRMIGAPRVTTMVCSNWAMGALSAG